MSGAGNHARLRDCMVKRMVANLLPTKPADKVTRSELRAFVSVLTQAIDIGTIEVRCRYIEDGWPAVVEVTRDGKRTFLLGDRSGARELSNSEVKEVCLNCCDRPGSAVFGTQAYREHLEQSLSLHPPSCQLLAFPPSPQALRPRRGISASSAPVYIVLGEGGMGTGERNSIKPAFTLLLASSGSADPVAFAERVGVGLIMLCFQVALQWPLHFWRVPSQD